MTATMVSLAAVALAYQVTLPQISTWFQFVGDGTGKNDAAANAVLLGTVLILFTTLVNAFGVKLMARINSAGVFIELIAAVAADHAARRAYHPRPQQRARHRRARPSGRTLGYFGAFLTASLASAYVMYGFDTASSLGEESHDPGRNAPRAILRALSLSFLIGGLILLFALMAVPNLASQELVRGRPAVRGARRPSARRRRDHAVVRGHRHHRLRTGRARRGIRLVFAMARDNNLPAGSLLAKVSPRFQTPVVPAVVIGLVAIVILVINVNQPQIFSVITSIAIIMIYVAYLLVTLPMLIQRLRGQVGSPPRASSRSAGSGSRSTSWPCCGAWRCPSTSPGRAPRCTTPPVRSTGICAGARSCSSVSSRSAASPTTGSCSATRRACSPSTPRVDAGP